MNSRLIFFLALLMSFSAALSQVTTYSDSVRINFRQSRIEFDSTYMDNQAALAHAREVIAFHAGEGAEYPLRRVEVVGAASPEGSVAFNEWLSHRRAERIFEILSKGIKLPDSITGFKFMGRDWGVTRQKVVNDPNVPYREEVLDLLDDIISNWKLGEKESSKNLERLKRLRGGVPYMYMYKNHFPDIRMSHLVLTYDIPMVMEVPDMPLTHRLEIPDVVMELPQTHVTDLEVKFCKPFYMSIHSNALLDLAGVPELGAEFYLGKDWSVKGNWMYGWWKTDRHHRYWRLYGGDLAARWWFGKAAKEKPLTGFHLGAYFGVFTYDFEWEGTGYLGGLPGRSLWARANYQTGVEFGYSLPIAPRWNIDFNLGCGYMWGDYRKYDPMESCYVWRSTHNFRWLGPTKAEVALTWLIGCDNYNRSKMKGGKK